MLSQIGFIFGVLCGSSVIAQYRLAAVPNYAAAPVLAKAPVYENDPYARYQFGYAVNDPHRGDYHSHHEEKEGGVVRGQYSLVEDDGSGLRTVSYIADPVLGFRATVDKGPLPVRDLQKLTHNAVPIPVAYTQPRIHSHAAISPAYAGGPNNYQY